MWKAYGYKTWQIRRFSGMHRISGMQEHQTDSDTYRCELPGMRQGDSTKEKQERQDIFRMQWVSGL